MYIGLESENVLYKIINIRVIVVIIVLLLFQWLNHYLLTFYKIKRLLVIKVMLDLQIHHFLKLFYRILLK